MEYLGRFKYEGAGITDGVFGVRNSLAALEGVDFALRYFIEKELPELNGVSYDIPVKIQEGSWELQIPEQIGQLMTVVQDSGLGTIVKTAVTYYLLKVANDAAKDGLLSTGPVKDAKAIFRKAITILQWIVAYVKHMQGFNRSLKTHLDNDNKIVIVSNAEGKQLAIPLELFGFVIRCPKNIVEGLVRPVSDTRTLKIGVNQNGKWVEESVGNKERNLFCSEEEQIDELPELEHGKFVVLQGVVVRANEKEQSLGLQYKDHTITCKPEEGRTLASFKSGIISGSRGKLYQAHVSVSGRVERVTVDGRYKTRPRIFISDIQAVNDGMAQMEFEIDR